MRRAETWFPQVPDSMCRPARATDLTGEDVAARIVQWRRMRMSWSAIARALGVAEPDVRRLHDPSWPITAHGPGANPVRRPLTPSGNPKGD